MVLSRLAAPRARRGARRPRRGRARRAAGGVSRYTTGSEDRQISGFWVEGGRTSMPGILVALS